VLIGKADTAFDFARQDSPVVAAAVSRTSDRGVPDRAALRSAAHRRRVHPEGTGPLQKNTARGLWSRVWLMKIQHVQGWRRSCFALWLASF
jgi:hypothetical protein